MTHRFKSTKWPKTRGRNEETTNSMGSLSGRDLARQVQAREPTFPVIYMTGAAADDWASQGVPNSILLQKPFAPAQLVTAISQLLNQVPPTRE